MPAAALPLRTPSSPGRERATVVPGRGRLTVARIDGASAVLTCAASSPLHIFTPGARGPAVSAMLATYGGGMVAGDAIDLTVEVGRGAVVALTTQAETKVYRSEGPWAAQRVSAAVAEGAALALVPEPTSCFEAARYRQAQRFELEPGASLLLLDSVTAGRSARGERWAFDAYLARNEVVIADRLVLRDSVRLVRGEGVPIPARMDGFELLATLVAVGPALRGCATALLHEIAGRSVDARAGVLAAASPLVDGVHLRVAARTVEEGLAFVRARITPAAAVFGARPLALR